MSAWAVYVYVTLLRSLLPCEPFHSGKAFDLNESACPVTTKAVPVVSRAVGVTTIVVNPLSRGCLVPEVSL